MRFVIFFAIATAAIAGEFTTSVGDTDPFQISAITTDAAGNTYVVGSRMLNGYSGVYSIPTGILPVSRIGTFLSLPETDVFVTKLDLTGKVLFTDTFAGKGADSGNAIAVDPTGNIYIAGHTTSDDFPLSRALQTQPSADGTGFIVKLSNDGTTILYSTYFGGTLGVTSITSLATDSQGNLYLTGYTNSADFPHTAGMPFGPVSLTAPATTGAIVASISAAGDKIRYSGALAGTAPACTLVIDCPSIVRMTGGVGIAVDPAGNAYIAGNTNTTDLPATAGVLSPHGTGPFIAKINAAGSGLSYLTYIDSAQIENPGVVGAASTLNAIAADAAGNTYLAGNTCDASFPATPGSLQPVYTSGPPHVCSPNGFLAKLKPDASALSWATYLGGVNTTVQSVAIDGFGNVWATGTNESFTTAIPGANGWSFGPEFLVGLNAAGSQLTYSALYPTGTIAQAVALDPAGFVHVAGANGFVSAISPYSAPAMKIFAFQNVAGGSATARISPAEVISIFGPGIGPATAVAATPASGFYPKTLAGVQVSIDGTAMPLLYVSANQVNAVVPMGITVDASATVHITNGATASPDYPVWIVGSAPESFAAVLNQNGTLNSSSNPAKSGSIVTFYATGWQSSFAPLTDGEVATAAQDTCKGSCQATLTAVGATFSSVLYAGAAPGIVAGVTQFNVQLGPFSQSAGANQALLLVHHS